MPADLLKLQYGPQTRLLPTRSQASNGTMYVHTSSTAVNEIYDATLYFDLDGKRYHIQGDKLDSLGVLSLQLNGTQLGNSYSGTSGSITWNIPLASDDTIGLVGIGPQTFSGNKTFTGTTTLAATNPNEDNAISLGTNLLRWSDVYAVTFHGELDGNAATATTADHTQGTLTISNGIGQDDETATKTFNGSQNVTITLNDFTQDGKLPLSLMPEGALERIYTYVDQDAAETAITNGLLQPGDLIKLIDTGVMYYVNNDSQLDSFIAGVSTEADHVSHVLTLQIIDNTTAVTFDGSNTTTFTIPAATAAVSGVVTPIEQIFGGTKTFSDTVNFNANIFTNSIIPSSNDNYSLGNTSHVWSDIYAVTVHAELDGNAATASKVNNPLTLNGVQTGLGGSQYDGSQSITIGSFKPATNNENGDMGFVPAPIIANRLGFLRGTGEWVTISGTAGITIGDTGDAATSISIGHNTSVTDNGNNNITITSGQTFSADQVTVDDYGHVSVIERQVFTANAVQESDYTSGDHIATILGTSIYSGIKWGTF